MNPLVFFNRHAPAILTATGIVGLISTAVLSHRAGIQAHEEIKHVSKMADRKLDGKEKVAAAWKYYIPPVVVGSLSIASILCAHRASLRESAAALALYTASEGAFKDYRTKVSDMLGEKSERKVHDEVAQDSVNRNPVSKSEVILTGGGESLFFDSFTGRYFKSDMESVRKAVNNTNSMIIHTDFGSLNDFYSDIGLERIALGDDIGWCNDHLLEVEFRATIAEDNTPAIVLTYRDWPERT